QGHLQGDDLDPFDPHVRRHTCLWRPRPSISSSTTSPSRRYSPVDRATPGGVPVMITSPGSRVMNWLRCQMMWVTEKSMLEVRLRCRTAPLTRHSMWRSPGSGTSSGVTSHGPKGENVSADLPLVHCPDRSSWCDRSE